MAGTRTRVSGVRSLWRPLTGLRRFALLGAGLIAWELLARSGSLSPIVFPSLGLIFREFGLLLSRGDRLVEAWYSLHRVLGGFALAAVAGVLIGMLMGRSSWMAGVLEPLFSGTYPVPKIALFPIFIFVFGIGSLSKVALVFLECLYPIVINTYYGTRTLNRVLLWSARNMGASSGQILWKIVVPATAPYIFAGFRVALPIAMIVVVITEMIGSADGLGYLVIYSLASFKTDRMLAAVLAISLLGLGLDGILVAIRRRVIFWEKQDTYY
jgi:ABC-type nitrate/sulfonate/bicarbonate transport system permease component